MATSAFKDQTTLAVVVEFCAFIGIASLALFIYTHRRALSNLRRAFRSRSVATISNSPGDPGQLTHQDLEKGVCVPSSDQPTDSDAGSDPHTRVFTYLCGLPREANDYMTMREISAEDDEGERASSVEGGCSEESGDSNWIEIINNFPPPPDVDLVRSLHAGSTSLNALGFVYDDPGAGGFPGNSSVISSSGTSEVATLGSHSQQTVVASPDSNGRTIIGLSEVPSAPLSESSNEHFTPGS